jgi:hypothetical protein
VAEERSFELTAQTVAGGSWTQTTLYSFADFGTNLNAPNTLYAGVSVGESGNVFGTTFNSHISSDGKSGGAAFMLTPPASPGGSWTESTLLNFWDVGIGLSPYAGVSRMVDPYTVQLISRTM